MTIEQIFKEKPELLKEECVIKLLEYVKEQHIRNINITKRHHLFFDNVFDLVMYSELVLIKGEKSKETLEKIRDLISDF